ncbi:MAG TPA: hypothetical protein VGX71_22700 [Pseudaminobacter sp.]|nr:hypothetical protein [Pseudaminobacter sp.]
MNVRSGELSGTAAYGATATSSVVAWDVGFQEAAMLISMSDMLNKQSST